MPHWTSLFTVVFLVFTFFPNIVLSIEDINLAVSSKPSRLDVDIQVIPSQSFSEEFREGLNKDVIILVELYRKWAVIPDEFVWGLKIRREFFSNPIKDEYLVRSHEGQTVFERRFKNSKEAIDWGLRVNRVSIETTNLERGKYYVKVTVESNIRKIPTLLEHFLFFIPRHEKKITRESEVIRIP